MFVPFPTPFVIAGFDPAIQANAPLLAWMRGSSPRMTVL
jgi:hypothetical protein